jgi:hypothetical protein
MNSCGKYLLIICLALFVMALPLSSCRKKESPKSTPEKRSEVEVPINKVASETKPSTEKVPSTSEGNSFPAGKLGIYLAEGLHLIVGYPLGWQTGKIELPPSQDDSLLYPRLLVNRSWLSPTFDVDTAAVEVLVQRPGGPPLLPSDLLDGCYEEIGDKLRKAGLHTTSPSLAKVLGPRSFQIRDAQEEREGVIIEGTYENGTWRCTLITTSRGLLYFLTLRVKQVNLDKYQELFKLVLKYFMVDVTLEGRPYSESFSALRHLDKKLDGRPILFSCGFIKREGFSVLADGSGLRRFGPGNLGCVVHPPDSDLVYCTLSFENGLFAFRVEGKEPVRLVLPIEDILTFDISPDGRQACYCGVQFEGLMVTPLDTFNPRQVVRQEARHPKWSPDGKSIAFTSFGQIHVISSAGGSARAISNASGSVEEWLPDGEGIIFCDDRGIIQCVDLVSGSVKRIVGTAYYNSDVRLSPDGRFIAYAAIRRKSRDIYVWDRKNKIELLIFSSSLNCDVYDW